jgi:hypothetical protein
LQARFSSGIRLFELRSIAIVVAHLSGVALERTSKRTLSCLVKWFADHWPAVAPFIALVNLVDAQGVAVTYARELAETF